MEKQKLKQRLSDQELFDRTKKKMIEAGMTLGFLAPETLTLSQELDEISNRLMGVRKNDERKPGKYKKRCG